MAINPSLLLIPGLSIARHPFEQAKMAYHPEMGMIFCRLDQFALAVSNDSARTRLAVTNHLRNCHAGQHAVTSMIRDEILEELAILAPAIDMRVQNEYKSATWDLPAPALELLPCSTAWTCTHCRWTRNNYRRMVTHVREHGEGQAELKEVTVQTVRNNYAEADTRYYLIPVRDPVPTQIKIDCQPPIQAVNAGSIPALDQVRSLLGQSEADLVINKQGARHLSEFHRSVDWADVMEMVGVPYLASLGRRDVLSTDPTWMKDVFKAGPLLFGELYTTLDKYRYHPFRADLQR